MRRNTVFLLLLILISLGLFIYNSTFDTSPLRYKLLRPWLTTPNEKHINISNIDEHPHFQPSSIASAPCFLKGLNSDVDFTNQKDCWQIFDSSNKMKAKTISPDNVLCAFEPRIVHKYKRRKKTVILGIGVHLGPAACAKVDVACSDMEYISWEYRDKHHGIIDSLLVHGYSEDHLRKIQEEFWNKYRNDPDLLRADIFECSFDSWHCLIFAPFNKKIVINSAYRFDGHIFAGEENSKKLQSVLYEAVRYNPDVILAGAIIYDVAYHQHYLGSHKMIPLPSTCEYVHQRLQQEIKEGKCFNLSSKTTGYHPEGKTISIFPKRLSDGGRVVAKEIVEFYKKKKRRMKIEVMEEVVHGFNYCDLGKTFKV